MKLLLWISALLLSAQAAAVPTRRAACTKRTQRKSWHTLTRDEKTAYINAEKCLMTLPAKLNLKGPRTRFDEFQKIHIQATTTVHFVGAFLPFHRYLMHAHEQILRTECNYTGAQPYWDETLDAGKFSTSIVLDPVTGFGGDGQGPNNCITDGPFKNYVNPLGPYQAITNHCIDRKINECVSATAAPKYVENCMAFGNYSGFWPCLEAFPHSAGHGGMGGEMSNVFSSPGDPLFYLHHTYLDKVWWDWQRRNLTTRLTDISGTNRGILEGFPGGSFPQFPPPGNGSCSGFPTGPFPSEKVPDTETQGIAVADSAGDPGAVTTLGHVLTLFGILPNVTIADVMDIQGGLLCYEYL